ncbi:MAG: alpha/beta hydrolase [Sphingomonadales bacterium]|nr:alpha/beta hydrolase [Sphingomonadales bacterium]
MTVVAEKRVGRPAIEADVISRDVKVPADDARPLAATLYELSAGGEGPITAIAAGAGIQRRYYGRFAAYLAGHGRPTLTFDYRDIGGSRAGSLKDSKVRMRDWCILDVPGVLAWMAREYPGRPIHWVGHSMGGFATGLAHNNHLVARQLNIATLNGYWGRMAVPERYRVRILMGMLGVPIARTLGYLPGFLMGGEDMPGPAFVEWAGWCMTPDFLFGDATLAERSNFARYRGPVRFAQIEDDVWGTPAAVEAMARNFRTSIDNSTWRIRSSDAGGAKIGHHGFFRDQFSDTLWPSALAWLAGASADKPARSPLS